VNSISEAARQEKNRYFREWRRRNPDKVKAAQRRYWERRAAGKKGKEGANNEKH